MLLHTPPPQATPDRPWLGLAHFTAADRDYFFGREAEIRELTERVRRAPVTVLYGVSGYGKSSLIGAGLIPHLQEDGYTVTLLRRCYDDLALRPLAGDVLAAVMEDYPAAVLPNSPKPTLWEFFHDRRQPWFGKDDETGTPPPRPVIILDQFEEIFTRGEDRSSGNREADAAARDHARDFLNQLADLVENRPPASLRKRLDTGTTAVKRELIRQYDFQARPLRTVLSLRDDFLARLERWRRVLPSMMEHRMELCLLAGPQAYLAVFQPGTIRPGLPPIISPEFATHIVRAVAGAADDVSLEEIDAVPPILSLLCERLNAGRLSGPAPADQIPAKDFSAKQVSQILGTFYADKLKPHPAALRHLLENELVSDLGFRKTVTVQDVIADLGTRVPDAEARLNQLVNDRILVIEARNGLARIEFTHDTLARHALDSKAGRQARARRMRTLAWTTASLAVAAICVAMILALVRERNAQLRERNAQLRERDAQLLGLHAQSQRAESERSLQLISVAHEAANHAMADIYVKLHTMLSKDGKQKEMDAAKKIFDDYLEQSKSPGGGDDSLYMDSVILNNKAYLARRIGDFAASQNYYESSLRIREDLAKRNVDSTRHLRGLASSHDNLGDLHLERAKSMSAKSVLGSNDEFKKAISDYRKGLKITELLATHDDASSIAQDDLALSYLKIGTTLFQEGSYQEALLPLQTGFANAERAAAIDPGYQKLQMRLGSYCLLLGRVCGYLVRDDLSRAYLLRGKEIFEKAGNNGSLSEECANLKQEIDKQLQESELTQGQLAANDKTGGTGSSTDTGTSSGTGKPVETQGNDVTFTILEVDGVVDYSYPPNTKWERAEVGKPLTAGCMVRTLERSRATLRIGNDRQMRLGEDSTVRLLPSLLQNEPLRVDLNRSETIYLHSREPGSGINIRTPTVNGIPHG